MSEIKKGDVVQLKSGGPLMTVQELDSWTDIENGALCVWFDDKKQHHEKVFDVVALRQVQE